MTDTHMLWLDLETTGTDETTDLILEIGAILTDMDLNVLGEYGTPISDDGTADLAMFVLTHKDDDYVLNMHTDNGLLDAIAEGSVERRKAEQDILDLLGVHGVKKKRCILAGSGVGHFDRRFLAVGMPELNAHLAYPTFDIGVIRRAESYWAPGWLRTANDDKPHRALADAHIHLSDARTYRSAFQAAVQQKEAR